MDAIAAMDYAAAMESFQMAADKGESVRLIARGRGIATATSAAAAPWDLPSEPPGERVLKLLAWGLAGTGPELSQALGLREMESGGSALLAKGTSV